ADLPGGGGGGHRPVGHPPRERPRPRQPGLPRRRPGASCRGRLPPRRGLAPACRRDRRPGRRRAQGGVPGGPRLGPAGLDRPAQPPRLAHPAVLGRGPAPAPGRRPGRRRHRRRPLRLRGGQPRGLDSALVLVVFVERERLADDGPQHPLDVTEVVVALMDGVAGHVEEVPLTEVEDRRPRPVVGLEALEEGPAAPGERAHGLGGVLGRDGPVVQPALGARPLQTQRPRTVRSTRPMSSRWWWPSWATFCTIAIDESSSSPTTTIRSQPPGSMASILAATRSALAASSSTTVPGSWDR